MQFWKVGGKEKNFKSFKEKNGGNNSMRANSDGCTENLYKKKVITTKSYGLPHSLYFITMFHKKINRQNKINAIQIVRIDYLLINY